MSDDFDTLPASTPIAVRAPEPTFACPRCKHRFGSFPFRQHLKTCVAKVPSVEEQMEADGQAMADDLEIGEPFTDWQRKAARREFARSGSTPKFDKGRK